MFKQVKSALFWYYLYKFRRRVLLISFLLLIAIFANAIYGDVIQYLTLKEKLEYLELAILIKWSIILFNILFSISLIVTIFKSKDEKEENKKETKNKKMKFTEKSELKEEIKESSISSKFSEREASFLKKDLLKSKADNLVER